MILDVTLPRFAKNTDKQKKGHISSPESAYQPKKPIKDRILQVMLMFSRSREIQNKGYEEFNNDSLIETTNACQKLFNNFREPKSSDADESWKSNAVRPIVRNRAISIAAHVAARVMKLNFFAQNEDQEGDKDAAKVMRDLMEFANDQADYERNFVYAIITSLVSPAVIIHTEYAQTFRTIKDLKDDGTWKEKVILDDLFSGFTDTIVPVEELFISNIYEADVQKQPYLIWRKVIDFETARQKYGDNKNFMDFVRPGIQVVFDGETNLFYDQFDEELREHLVEEVIYYDRFSDLQLILVNGILLDDPDSSLKRKDKMYPFAKGGYELINEGKFFYFFPLVRKMKDDAEIINTLYNIVIDISRLQAIPPTAIFGDEIINASVIAPGVATVFSGDTKIQKLDTTGNLSAAMSTLDRVEGSATESSGDRRLAGQETKGSQTAFEISRLEQNAQIVLGLFGKMARFLVEDWGKLKTGDILQFLTVADITKLVGDDAPLKYRSFLIPDQMDTDGSVDHRLLFTDSIKLSEDKEERQLQMFALEGGASQDKINELSPEERREFVKKGFKGKNRLFIINPSVFRQLKYKVITQADLETPTSDLLNKALNIELYDRAIASPLANQETLYRDLLLGSYEKTKGDPDKYVNKQLQPAGQPPQGSVLNKVFGRGQQSENNAAARQLGTAAKV